MMPYCEKHYHLILLLDAIVSLLVIILTVNNVNISAESSDCCDTEQAPPCFSTGQGKQKRESIGLSPLQIVTFHSTAKAGT